jgi:hypothetical protein
VVNFEKDAKIQALIILAPVGMLLMGLFAASLLPNYISQTDKARVRPAQAHIHGR